MNFMHITIYVPRLKWKENKLLLSIFHVSGIMGKQFMCILYTMYVYVYALYYVCVCVCVCILDTVVK